MTSSSNGSIISYILQAAFVSVAFLFGHACVVGDNTAIVSAKKTSPRKSTEGLSHPLPR